MRVPLPGHDPRVEGENLRRLVVIYEVGIYEDGLPSTEDLDEQLNGYSSYLDMSAAEYEWEPEA